MLLKVLPSQLYSNMVGRLKATDAGRLRAEYNRLVDGLAQRGDLPSMLSKLVST